MQKIETMLIQMYVMAMSAINDFKKSERGDTNFVSMLLIIGIVVVLAGLFLTLGKSVMTTITQNVNKFLKSLK
jgi:purine-cytosine permease-like protein